MSEAVIEKRQIPIYNLEGEKKESAFEKSIFEPEVSPKLVSLVARVLLSRQHIQTAATKTRALVRGGGAKPWRQKGTGRARAGSRRAPQWRGGGIVHGPIPSERKLRVPKKWKKAALREVLRRFILEDNLYLIEKLDTLEPKTRKVTDLINKIGLTGKILVLLNEPSVTFSQAARNLAKVRVKTIDNLNVLDLLNTHKVLVEGEAFQKIKADLDKKDGKKASNY